MRRNRKGPGPGPGDSGECRCCGATKTCRVLNVEYEWKGEKEIYSDIFVECFGLLLSNLDGDKSRRLICPTCVVRLRDANAFRQQVLQWEEKLHNAIVLLDDDEHQLTDIKCEIECDIDDDSRPASDMELEDSADPLAEEQERKINKKAQRDMPYKIVQVIQNGKFNLIPVPESWEREGIIHWPPSTSDIKNRRKPENCIVKRRGLRSLEEAEREIERMNQFSQSESFSNRHDGTLNRLIDDGEDDDQPLMKHRKTEITLEPCNATNSLNLHNKIPQNLESTLIDISTKLQSIQKIQQSISTEVLKMRENQQNIYLEIAKTNLNLEECINKGVLSGNNTGFGNQMDFKPIETEQELNDLEKNLADPVFKAGLEKMFSVVCGYQEGKGLNAAYKLVDMIFSRQFLVQCSWAGGSRNEESKICFKVYKRIIEFFFTLVKATDSLYKLQDCETFFKIVLKNSKSRCKLGGLRESAMKNRPKRIRIAENEADNVTDDISNKHAENSSDDIYILNISQETE